MDYAHTIASDVRSEIDRRIASAEQEHGVRVLYAVESGSRAWGFASQNSDYDVRFIYAHSQEWYLSVDLEEKRDVIEYPIVDEIDISGWDIRKALQLYYRSNPSIIEWLHSPIVYRCDDQFAPGLRALLATLYSPQRGIYHYRSMAKANYRSCLRQPVVPLKKYFYVLRPLLAVRWLQRFGTPAPIEFERLRDMVQCSDLNKEIELLLERKRHCKEKEMIPAIPVLNRFIESELQRMKSFAEHSRVEGTSYQNLNSLFRVIVTD